MEDHRMSLKELRMSPMMAHLLDALDNGQDIGHYGRLVFAMVGHHFLDQEALEGYLCKDPSVTQEEARALCLQVEGRDCSPPTRERILQWQQEQVFPICPNPDDPDACNVYKEARFPDEVFERISDYSEQKAEA
jgi:hypothetical protein